MHGSSWCSPMLASVRDSRRHSGVIAGCRANGRLLLAWRTARRSYRRGRSRSSRRLSRPRACLPRAASSNVCASDGSRLALFTALFWGSHRFRCSLCWLRTLPVSACGGGHGTPSLCQRHAGPCRMERVERRHTSPFPGAKLLRRCRTEPGVALAYRINKRGMRRGQPVDALAASFSDGGATQPIRQLCVPVLLSM
jgi:hypothetical protein